MSVRPSASQVGIPAYQPRNLLLARRLKEAEDGFMNELASLDKLLGRVADQFEEAFARDDARAATRARIDATAQAHRRTQRGN